MTIAPRPNFIALGIACLLLLLAAVLAWPELKAIQRSLASFDWERSEARIVTLSYDYVTSSHGTTYRTRGQYAYNWNGQSYTSSQLYFATSSDNLGFHKNKYREWLRAKNKSADVPVWVNPVDPKQAVLYRGVRLDLLGAKFIVVGMCLILGGVILIATLLFYRERKRYVTLAQRYPNQPWMWRDDWQSDPLPNRGKSHFVGHLLFTLFVSLIASSSLFVIPRELADKNYFVLLALVPLGVAFLMTWSTYLKFRSLFFEKHIELFLDTRPVLFLGKVMQARLVMPQQFQTEHTDVKLQKMRIETNRVPGEGTVTKKFIEFQVPCLVERCANVQGRQEFRLSVEVPVDAAATSWELDNNEHYWELDIQLRINHRKVFLNFDLPVADPERHLSVFRSLYSH